MDVTKIIDSITEPLLSAPLTREQRTLLGLQLLAWVRLSEADDALEPQYRVGHVKDGATSEIIDAAKFLDEWNNKAFRGLASLAMAVGANAVRQVLEECSKLNEQGHLQAFDPRDVLAEVAPFGSGGISPDLANLMVGLLGLAAHETVYCAWDTTGQLVGRLLPKADLVFSETLGAMPTAALMAIFLKARIEEEITDPLRDPKAVEDRRLRQFDVALGLPPIGEKLDASIVDKDRYQRFNIPKASRTVLAIQHLLAHAKRRVVVAIPNSVLFNASSDAEFRKNLLLNGQIQTVIALPPGLLRGSALPLSLLVLSKNGGHHTTRFINADVDSFRTSQSRMRVTMNHLDELIAISHGPEDGLLNQPYGLVVDVPVKRILDNGAQLQVSSYLLPREQQTLGFLLQDIPTSDLGDLVETLRPTLLKRKKGKSVQIREVGTADLPSYGSMTSLAKETEVPAELVEKARLQFLAPGDIVLMVKGNVGKVGIVPDSAPPSGPGGWVLGQSTIALRVKPEIGIDPRALFMLLRSPLGQGLLRCIVLGATIPLISMRHLIQLEIPLPSPEESASAVDILAREDELQRQIDELAAQQSKLARDLWSLDLV